MTDALVRNDLIELLERLGSDSDEDALDAARQLHARVSAAKVSWRDLLVADDRPTDSHDAEDELTASADEEAQAAPPAPTDDDNAHSLTLIDKMLFFLPAAWLGLFDYLGAGTHFENITKGVVDTRDLNFPEREEDFAELVHRLSRPVKGTEYYVARGRR